MRASSTLHAIVVSVGWISAAQSTRMFLPRNEQRGEIRCEDLCYSPLRPWLLRRHWRRAPAMALAVQVTVLVVPAMAGTVRVMVRVDQAMAGAILATAGAAAVPGQVSTARALVPDTAIAVRSGVMAGVDPKAMVWAPHTREPVPGRSTSVSPCRLAKSSLEGSAPGQVFGGLRRAPAAVQEQRKS
jgi:hypothetical protein